MRIVTLTEETKDNILENLLKRSPNSYGEYEGQVSDIIENVRKNKDAAIFEYSKKFACNFLVILLCYQRSVSIYFLPHLVANPSNQAASYSVGGTRPRRQ